MVLPVGRLELTTDVIFGPKVSDAAHQADISIGQVHIRITPKVDGLAWCDEDGVLASRGQDGIYGEDMSAAFERGLVTVSGRNHGAGEVVVVEQYFKYHIAKQFDIDHPRNFMVGLVATEKIKPHHANALEAGVCRFVPYSTLEWVDCSLEEFRSSWHELLMESYLLR